MCDLVSGAVKTAHLHNTDSERVKERERERHSERMYSSKSTLDSFKVSKAILNFACAYTAETKHTE